MEERCEVCGYWSWEDCQYGCLEYPDGWPMDEWPLLAPPKKG